MPKVSLGLPKSERHFLLSHILEQGSRLSKSEIDKRVLAELSSNGELLDTKAQDLLKKRLYEDLEEFEADGLVWTWSEDEDGVCRPHDRGKKRLGREKQWSWRGNETVMGLGLLSNLDASLLVSKRLRPYVRIGANISPSQDSLAIACLIGTSPIGIQVSKDRESIHRITLVVGSRRSQQAISSSITSLERLEESIAKDGEALLALVLPALGNCATVSSFGGEGKNGHLRIDIDEEGLVSLTDLNSSRGSSYIPLSYDNVEAIIRELCLPKASTAAALKSELQNRTFSKIGFGTRGKIPFLAYASDFWILVS